MATLKNLNDREYFLRETNTNNSYLNIHGLDTVVGSGFYSFYIVGSRHLEKGSEIRFEIVDSAGNPVEIAGVRSIRKGNARIISFSITDEVANGGATLYVQATLNKYLDENNFPTSVPSEWAGRPNLLFSYNFTIDKDKINSDDIIFRKQPKVDITPTVKEVDRVGKNSITVSTGSGGAPLTGSVVEFEQISESDYLVTFEADKDSFIGDMRHGNIRFINRKYEDDSGNIKTFSYVSNSLNPIDDGYEGSINKIRNKKLVEAVFVNPDLDVFGPGGNISYESTFIPKGQDYTFEIDYVTDVFTEESLIQQGTYADIRLRDLHTVSGDVELIKIYTKSDSEGTNYSLIFEGEIDEQESLLEVIDNFDIGLFNSSSKLTQWTASDATNSNNTPADTTPEFLLSDDLLLNGAVISGSNDVFTKEVNGQTLQTPLYSLESNTSFTLYRDIDYTIALNAAVENVTTDDTRLDVYISGSNLPKGCSNKFGTLIHSFRTDSDKKWFSDDIQITYNRENTIRDARIIFVVTSGKWHLSDIELNPNILKGFTPGEYRAQVPLNVLRPNQDFDFKIEFYDGAGAKANTIVYEDNVTFERSNIVIEGHKNLVTGSLFVGDNTGSGVQFGSSGDGGNFASVGYEGFTSASQKIAPAGFLMWSGSVLPNSGDNYQGVGLELVIDSESYFRYRTNPEELTVRTDNFFFGDPNSQFISGSNGNIEISSSLFHLDPSNDILIISGTIQANFGSIGGWEIGPTFLSSSNILLDSLGSIQTADFLDGVRGWQVTSEGNGTAQFENVKIRGTLRATVFEKETVNAVGGQLWVANSTIVSESISAAETTMSVENVTGFVNDEILLIKKVTGTGINSEYVLVESSSRISPGSETDLRGYLYVDRAYASGSTTGSGVTWVSELASGAEDYTEGQVIVSTGRTNTGWILLNASPSNDATPYIDIIERTGSGIYDYELKARLGDLSGLTSTQLNGDSPANAGFGLFSENVYLTGTINARTGSIGEWEIVDGKISGSNITLDADDSTLYKTDQGPGSDPQAPGFEQLANEYYIDFTPSASNNNPYYVKFGPNFSVDVDGILFASGAVFEGTITASAGKIGGFIIGSSSLFNPAQTFYLSGSATGNDFFISSSAFNVKANGDVTGSSVLFDGGIIGGFELGQSIISSSNGDLVLRDNGQITGSNVLFDGGIIAGWSITTSSFENIVSGDGIKIEALNDGGQITMFSASNDVLNMNVGAGLPILTSADLFYSSSESSNFAEATGSNPTGDTVTDTTEGTAKTGFSENKTSIFSFNLSGSTSPSGKDYTWTVRIQASGSDTGGWENVRTYTGNQNDLEDSFEAALQSVGYTHFRLFLSITAFLTDTESARITSTNVKVEQYNPKMVFNEDGIFQAVAPGIYLSLAGEGSSGGGTISSNVNSVFGRTGDILAESGDYSASQVDAVSKANGGTFSGSVGINGSLDIVNSVTASKAIFDESTVYTNSKYYVNHNLGNVSGGPTGDGVFILLNVNGSDYDSTLGTVVGTRSGVSGGENTIIEVATHKDGGDTREINFTAKTTALSEIELKPKVVNYNGVEYIAILYPSASNDRNPSHWAFTGWHSPNSQSLKVVNVNDALVTSSVDFTGSAGRSRTQFGNDIFVSGSDIQLSDSGAVTTGAANYGFESSGTSLLLEANNVVKIDIDNNNNATDKQFIISHDNQNEILFRVNESGLTEVLGDLDVSGGLTITGSFNVGDALLSNQENPDVDTGLETVASITSSYDGAFFDYVIKSGSNLRAGTVYSVHDGTNVEFTEVSTNDLGNTSDVELLVDLSGGDLRLRATASSNNWDIRSLVRGL